MLTNLSVRIIETTTTTSTMNTTTTNVEFTSLSPKSDNEIHLLKDVTQISRKKFQGTLIDNTDEFKEYIYAYIKSPEREFDSVVWYIHGYLNKPEFVMHWAQEQNINPPYSNSEEETQRRERRLLIPYVWSNPWFYGPLSYCLCTCYAQDGALALSQVPDLFTSSQEQHTIIKQSLMLHSMGNYLFSFFLSESFSEGKSHPSILFDNIFMVAPDVRYDLFTVSSNSAVAQLTNSGYEETTINDHNNSIIDAAYTLDLSYESIVETQKQVEGERNQFEDEEVTLTKLLLRDHDLTIEDTISSTLTTTTTTTTKKEDTRKQRKGQKFRQRGKEMKKNFQPSLNNMLPLLQSCRTTEPDNSGYLFSLTSKNKIYVLYNTQDLIMMLAWTQRCGIMQKRLGLFGNQAKDLTQKSIFFKDKVQFVSFECLTYWHLYLFSEEAYGVYDEIEYPCPV